MKPSGSGLFNLRNALGQDGVVYFNAAFPHARERHDVSQKSTVSIPGIGLKSSIRISGLPKPNLNIEDSAYSTWDKEDFIFLSLFTSFSLKFLPLFRPAPFSDRLAQ